MSKHKHEHLTGEKPASHTNQMILMIVFFAVWITDSFLLRITTFLFDLNLIWLYIIPGIIILALSVYMMDRSHKDLFDSRVESVASIGVYGRVRHPMYLGTFLFYLGLAVITFSIASLAVWLVAVAYYNSLANYEENLLETRFENEYLEYKKSVRKWIPV